MNSFLRGIKQTISVAGQLVNRANLLAPVPSTNVLSHRSVIYFTHSKGKFRSNKAVLRRFYRLNWGAWIRPRAGRHKHLWRKPFYIRWWAKQHVFCTDEQNKVLDQMVAADMKRPKYFVDDPYAPYEKRRSDFRYVPLGKDRVTTSYINILAEKP
ncbi:hypothetical protein RDWZM_000202 [Blomia tropicalis]|uniref:Large ribosomal subunit protein bL35m n=1 Tax=Blomia tropicalis TaxID=40697 RepID=A0A9Q0MCD8_BLOTA|nr:hypothetical protein RDWZM_000202 [Blomia tropicalis]